MVDVEAGLNPRELEERGISRAEVNRQIRIFENPPPCIELDRPCRLGDGIRLVDDNDAEIVENYEQAAGDGRLLKFVPASGAASRMFAALLAVGGEGTALTRESVERLAARGDESARQVIEFVDGLTRFAFFADLQAAMSRDGLDATGLAEAGQLRQIVDYLLTRRGLNYAALPKGLISFHRYPQGSRTAFQEHLAEAAAYARDRDQVCRVHLTVSPEHREGFGTLLERIRPQCEDRYGVRFQVGFSTQKRSTDTLAVDLHNRPFRTEDGRVLFRPAGHGALIENLNDVQGDIIFIQNVDNILPDGRRGEVVRCKRSLTGYLAGMQKKIFGFLSALAAGAPPAQELLDEALAYVAGELGMGVPPGVRRGGPSAQHAFLLDALDRPLRVCGVVKNTGEPGGGPFWVRGRDGGLSLQIVESAQVDPHSAEQRDIFAASTHFNPVNLVCGVRNWRGEPYDLRGFVDSDAVFIARKSSGGRELKALERPGLWNGAMAGWLTVFVELPMASFTPVKTVNDLLRPEHQPRLDS